jgi:hypothetical protein
LQWPQVLKVYIFTGWSSIVVSFLGTLFQIERKNYAP